jgi:hypothetical protein
LKLVATEQNDAISGIGQDCTGKEYELSIAAAQGTAGQGYITFVGHKMASLNTYTELGNFNFANSSFNVNGTINSSAVKGGMWIYGTHEAAFMATTASTQSAGNMY